MKKNIFLHKAALGTTAVAAGFELHLSAALSLTPLQSILQRAKPKWMQRADVTVFDMVFLAALVPPG